MIGICRYGNAVIAVALAFYFFLIPGTLVVRDIVDPNLRGPGIPKRAWELHRTLTPRYEKWARARVASGRAASLSLYDVPSTEWPMFGSVYYLWATESLQRAWEQDHSLSPVEPRVYARKTIEAAVDLVLDPVHHTWVRTHWGPGYMHRENVFFRTLIIAALTAHERLVGGGQHRALLQDQVDTLAAELDASPLGVLEDYPGECYPIDVLAAIACIRRADAVLGTDHSAFAARSIRAFSGKMLDQRGLIPYFVEATSGTQGEPSRGVGNSYVLIFAHELWPDVAAKWYSRYDKYFWQARWWAAGFREYPRELAQQDWSYDVDAGPIIAGFSPAANAFGLAAAKVNGRLDHAYVLASQVLTAAWPLPDGTLLGSRMLSNAAHAPYLGEACLLFILSQRPAPGMPIRLGGHAPGLVYIGLLFFFGTGAAIVIAAWRGVRRWRAGQLGQRVRAQRLQVVLWCVLVAGGLGFVAAGQVGVGMISLLAAQFLPRVGRPDGAGIGGAELRAN